MQSYRYPNERLILGLTLLLVLAVIALTATATVCTSIIFVALALSLGYSSSRSHHQALLRQASAVTPQSSPGLARLVEQCVARLQPGSIQVFVAPSRALNAYTFGLDTPKVVVLYTSLLRIMDEDELRFIIGHEFGHVALGHTWLNSLVGGMAGIPSSSGASTILMMVFLWWNRTCELSADRAGLLACGSLDKAVSALVKLVAGPQALSSLDLQKAYARIDAEDDTIWGTIGESLGTHPMLIRRITELRKYAGTHAYQTLQTRLEQV